MAAYRVLILTNLWTFLFSITVSNAGTRYMPDQDESFISHLLKRELTGQERYPSGGVSWPRTVTELRYHSVFTEVYLVWSTKATPSTPKESTHPKLLSTQDNFENLQHCYNRKSWINRINRAIFFRPSVTLIDFKHRIWEQCCHSPFLFFFEIAKCCL